MRPFLVAIRARNPWVRARFRTLGWKVRFMAAILELQLRCERRARIEALPAYVKFGEGSGRPKAVDKWAGAP